MTYKLSETLTAAWAKAREFQANFVRNTIPGIPVGSVRDRIGFALQLAWYDAKQVAADAAAKAHRFAIIAAKSQSDRNAHMAAIREKISFLQYRTFRTNIAELGAVLQADLTELVEAEAKLANASPIIRLAAYPKTIRVDNGNKFISRDPDL